MNNLQMQIFQDFVLTKNQTGNNIIRAFTHKKKILHDVLVSNVLDDDDDDDDDDDILLNYRQTKSKILNFVETTVVSFSDCEFKAHFRLSRTTIEILLQHLSLPLERYKMEIPVDKQVLVFVWYMANCETHRQIGNRFDIAESTSYKIVIHCLTEINNLSGNFIQWPTNHKAQTVVQKFNSLRGEHSFPGVFGAIDGCHISILAPWEKRTKMPKLNRTMFYNRKQVPTVLLLGIVDSDLKFIDCFAGWPGSSHDARVFRRSIIGEKLLSQPCVILPPGCHILGDGAYPLTSTLMVPFKDNGHLSDSQLKFNKCLSSSRVVIEQAFGKLIGRFRKLKHMDIYHKENCSKVITAACFLHNLCIDNSDDFNSTEIYTSEMEDGNHHEDDSLSGNVKRQELCQQLSLIL